MSTTVIHIREKQPGDIYIGRPRGSQAWGFGNPFTMPYDGNRAEVIRKYRAWLETGQTYGNTDATPERRTWVLQNIPQLKGRRLVCFCKPKPCHGDVLKEMADKVNNE